MSSISRICGCRITEGFGEYPQKPKICAALLITTSLVVFSILVFKSFIPITPSHGVWFLGAATLPLICGVVYSIRKEKLNIQIILESEQLLASIRNQQAESEELFEWLIHHKACIKKDREWLDIEIQKWKRTKLQSNFSKSDTPLTDIQTTPSTFKELEVASIDSKNSVPLREEVQKLPLIDRVRPKPTAKIVFISFIALSIISLFLAVSLHACLGSIALPCTYTATVCIGISSVLGLCLPLITHRANKASRRLLIEMDVREYEITQGKPLDDFVKELEAMRAQQLADLEELQREMRLEENPQIAREIRGTKRRELMDQSTPTT